MIETVIIGSGNVAQTLATSLTRAGAKPLQIFARNREAAAKIAQECGCEFGSEPEELAKAELYIIAVSDKAIGAVSKSLDFGSAVVAHTAGSVGIDKLDDAIRNKAVLYPLQTLTKGCKSDFKEVPILIEGSNSAALETVKQVAELLSEKVLLVDSKQRALIHLAAVFVGNFSNHMYVIGEELARDAGMEFEVLKPLIVETTKKAMRAQSPQDVQTGPAVRNDFQTKSLHTEMLVERPELKSIYTNLSNSIWEISKKKSQK